MLYKNVIHKWNNRSDEHNQWKSLGEDEKIEYAIQCGIQLGIDSKTENKTSKPEVYFSDDYAGLECSTAKFYYGYEVTENDEWCFTAKIDGIKKIKIPFSELYSDDSGDCLKCLLFGIASVIDKYGINLKKE